MGRSMDIFDSIGNFLKSPFTVGSFGAAVFALKFAPGETWQQRVVNIVAGGITAGYISPALVEYLELQSTGFSNAVAFGVGLLGMSLIAAILQAIRETKLADFIPWPRRNKGNDQ